MCATAARYSCGLSGVMLKNCYNMYCLLVLLLNQRGNAARQESHYHPCHIITQMSKSPHVVKCKAVPCRSFEVTMLGRHSQACILPRALPNSSMTTGLPMYHWSFKWVSSHFLHYKWPCIKSSLLKPVHTVLDCQRDNSRMDNRPCLKFSMLQPVPTVLDCQRDHGRMDNRPRASCAYISA